MFKKYIKILSNPLLYYSDKEGNSVFRNFSLIKETGDLYSVSIPKPNVGKILEYRFQLDKYLKLAYFFTTLILYFIFIHINFSIINLLIFELIWICIINGVRLWLSYLYHEKLVKSFGPYEVVDFNPPISSKKTAEFVALYRSKVLVIVILIILLYLPSLLLQFGIKHSLTLKHNGYKHAIQLSNVYNAFYPKTARIYDMRALAHFMQRDYENSLKDYKIALNISGRNFTNKDVIRFANLLLVQKRVHSSTEAIDVFNEYITRKKMSVLEESQMLWIKSIFKIENNIIDYIIQDYDNLLASIDSKDIKNHFYISSDKAYIMYLMQQYESALSEYNVLISYAEGNQQTFNKEIPALYAERGWTKKRLGDDLGANIDFRTSQISMDDIAKYEPAYSNQEFVREKF